MADQRTSRYRALLSAWMLIIFFNTVSCSRVDSQQKASPPHAAERRRVPPIVEDNQALPVSEVAADEATSAGSRQDQQRRRMVDRQLAARDITNERVLAAMRRVPRHRFVPSTEEHRAYIDSPLPIGHGQTISQPYIVALMTQLADPQPAAKALDIGTGSGYQAAVLAEIVDSVYSIEIVEPLARDAKARLESLGYEKIHVRHGDGYRGWREQAPFDIIIVAAAPDHVPERLVQQLAPGGKMVIPVGNFYQSLLLIEKAKDGKVSRRKVAAVAFVPMTGEARQ